MLDEDDFRARARAFRDAFGEFDVYYAGKAFLSTEVARWVAEEGLSIDVASAGELTVAQRAGFPMARVGYHGNNKSFAELMKAVDLDVGRIIVDSFVEIERLAEVARETGSVARVMVRVTVGVEAHTHEYIATAHEDQKFGFSLASGDALEAVRRVKSDPVPRAHRASQPHRVADLRHASASRSRPAECSRCMPRWRRSSAS